EELESEVDETTGEGDESPLVGDAEEGEHGSLFGMDWETPGTKHRMFPGVNERPLACGGRGVDRAPAASPPSPADHPAALQPSARLAPRLSPRWPRGAWRARGSPPGGCAPG